MYIKWEFPCHTCHSWGRSWEFSTWGLYRPTLFVTPCSALPRALPYTKKQILKCFTVHSCLLKVTDSVVFGHNLFWSFSQSILLQIKIMYNFLFYSFLLLTFKQNSWESIYIIHVVSVKSSFQTLHGKCLMEIHCAKSAHSWTSFRRISYQCTRARGPKHNKVDNQCSLIVLVDKNLYIWQHFWH